MPSILQAFAGLDHQWTDPWCRIYTALLRTFALPGANIVIDGPPSVGKTFAAENYGCRPEDIVIVATPTPEMPAAELRGFYVMRAGNYDWVDGPVTDALRTPNCRLVLNDIHNASGDVEAFLLGIMEDPKFVRVRLPNREIVRPAEGFRVVATMNGSWQTLSDALKSRFPIRISVGQPNPEMLASFEPEIRNLIENTSNLRDAQRIRAADLGLFKSADARTWNLLNKYYQRAGRNEAERDAARFVLFGAEGRELRDGDRIAAS